MDSGNFPDLIAALLQSSDRIWTSHQQLVQSQNCLEQILLTYCRAENTEIPEKSAEFCKSSDEILNNLPESLAAHISETVSQIRSVIHHISQAEQPTRALFAEKAATNPLDGAPDLQVLPCWIVDAPSLPIPCFPITEQPTCMAPKEPEVIPEAPQMPPPPSQPASQPTAPADPPPCTRTQRASRRSQRRRRSLRKTKRWVRAQRHLVLLARSEQLK